MRGSFVKWACSLNLTGAGTDLPHTFCRMRRLRELPEELRWTIMGFLDVWTLCTARLVCKSFRACAGSHFTALYLRSSTLEENPTTDFTQFSGATHLAVDVSYDRDVCLLAHPRIAPVVTHVRLRCITLRVMPYGHNLAQLTLLPSTVGTGWVARNSVAAGRAGGAGSHGLHQGRPIPFDAVFCVNKPGLASVVARYGVTCRPVGPPETALPSLAQLPTSIGPAQATHSPHGSNLGHGSVHRS
jgi:hypothetical protein